MQSAIRILGNLKYSQRTKSPFGKAQGQTLAQKQGLRYEKNVFQEFNRLKTLGYFGEIEYNPWFDYCDEFGSGLCCPDFIIHTSNAVIVVEVKHTWVPEAIIKLDKLYSPIVANALNCPAVSLVICKNVTKDAPKAKFDLYNAIHSPERLLHWPKYGHIQWKPNTNIN